MFMSTSTPAHHRFILINSSSAAIRINLALAFVVTGVIACAVPSPVARGVGSPGTDLAVAGRDVPGDVADVVPGETADPPKGDNENGDVEEGGDDKGGDGGAYLNLQVRLARHMLITPFRSGLLVSRGRLVIDVSRTPDLLSSLLSIVSDLLNSILGTLNGLNLGGGDNDSDDPETVDNNGGDNGVEGEIPIVGEVPKVPESESSTLLSTIETSANTTDQSCLTDHSQRQSTARVTNLQILSSRHPIAISECSTAIHTCVLEGDLPLSRSTMRCLVKPPVQELSYSDFGMRFLCFYLIGRVAGILR